MHGGADLTYGFGALNGLEDEEEDLVALFIVEPLTCILLLASSSTIMRRRTIRDIMVFVFTTVVRLTEMRSSGLHWGLIFIGVAVRCDFGCD